MPTDLSIASQVMGLVRGLPSSKIVDVALVKQARAAMREFSQTVVSETELAEYEPDHALYLLAQNLASVQTEILTGLPQMDPFSNLIQAAERRFGTPGSPQSPLTLSFFTCWAFFDAFVGKGRETIGDILVELAKVLPGQPDVHAALSILATSRMGVFEHEGWDGGLVVLRELVTGEACHCLVPAGYPGKRRELWFARVLPSPLPGLQRHIVFTTPYVLVDANKGQWLDFLLADPDQESPAGCVSSYSRFMKYGPDPLFWPRFVRNAFRDRHHDVIWLAGLPGCRRLEGPARPSVSVGASPERASPGQAAPAPLAYTNRKGRTYYLCEVERQGKTRLVMARTIVGRPVHELPGEFEVSETIHGTVSVRRARSSRIWHEEFQALEDTLAEFPRLAGYRVERREADLLIHEPLGVDAALAAELGVSRTGLREKPLDRIRYSPVLRFILVDDGRRSFAPQRMCWRGGADRWIPLGQAAGLQELSDRYLGHLGQESFFDLL